MATLRFFCRNNPRNRRNALGTRAGYESGNSRHPFWFADRCACLSRNPRPALQSLSRNQRNFLRFSEVPKLHTLLLTPRPSFKSGRVPTAALAAKGGELTCGQTAASSKQQSSASAGRCRCVIFETRGTLSYFSKCCSPAIECDGGEDLCLKSSGAGSPACACVPAGRTRVPLCSTGALLKTSAEKLGRALSPQARPFLREI